MKIYRNYFICASEELPDWELDIFWHENDGLIIKDCEGYIDDLYTYLNRMEDGEDKDKLIKETTELKKEHPNYPKKVNYHFHINEEDTFHFIRGYGFGYVQADHLAAHGVKEIEEKLDNNIKEEIYHNGEENLGIKYKKQWKEFKGLVEKEIGEL